MLKTTLNGIDVLQGSESDERSGSPGSQGDDVDDGKPSITKPPNMKMTRCMVCKELTDNHHIHYGALCCFSCRAFFRRANQRTKKASYVCKQDGKCDVTYKNRKKCQKCRYEACLAAGMDPNLVLTEEQKKARFRKKSEKRADNGRQHLDSESELRNIRPRDSFGTAGRGGLNGQKRRRRTAEFALHNTGMTSPDLYDEIPTVSGYDDFELMLHQYSGGSLQSDTLRDVQDTLSLAQEWDSVGRNDQNNIPSFSVFSNIMTDRQPMRAYDPTLLSRSAEQTMIKRMASSVPTFSSWNSYPTAFDQQSEQLLLETSCQQQEILLPKVDDFSTTFMLSSQPRTEQPQLPQIQIEEPPAAPVTMESNFLPSADDLFADPLLKPLGIEPVSETDQHVISPYCGTPLFGSSILGSPISTSLLNTPVASPGKLSPDLLSTSETAGVVPKVEPEAEPDPNDTHIKQLIDDFGGPQLEIDLIQRLISFQSGNTHLSEYDVDRLIFHIGETFRQFAVKQTVFQDLSVTEQCQLLTANQPLFIHYILGRYFIATDGKNQIQWFIGPAEKSSTELCVPQMLYSVEHVSLKVFNRDAGLFSDSVTMRKYYEKATSGLSGVDLTYNENGLVAAIILFSGQGIGRPLQQCDGSDEMTSVQLLNEQLSILNDVIRKSTYKNRLPENLAQLVAVLSDLKSTFLSQPGGHTNETLKGDWTGPGEIHRMGKELGMPHTREEEEWLGLQMAKYSSAYREVPMGEEFLKEFIMFSYDVPLSKHFVYRGYATFAERFRRVLETQPGFNELNDKDQALVWRQGCAKSVACCFAKTEHCKTGRDQLQFMFGELDKNNWKQNYENQVTMSRIKKILMSDCNKMSATFSTEELMDYLRIVGTLGEITSYEEIFPILTLIALLSGEGLTSDGARFATDMRNKYFTVLGRKLAGNRRAYSNVCLGLNEIDELSLLMKKLET